MIEKTQFITEIPVIKDADVVVVGGGPAGIASAISAARTGKKVILLEKSAQLGGMGTLAGVGIFMIVGNFTGIYKELVNDIRPDFETLYPDPENYKVHFNPFLLRYYLSKKLREEKVEVIYHASFLNLEEIKGGTKIVHVNTVEGIRGIAAKIVIDCTGNGSVAIDAGAKYHSGRLTDNLVQPMTMMFQMQDTGKPVTQVLPEGCYYYEKEEDLPQGRRLFWEMKPEGTLLVNMTRVRGNGVRMDDLNDAEEESLKQVLSVVHYLQRNGFETYILSHVGSQVGVRETYQVLGEYQLTENDLCQGRRFHDVVAQTNYNIDIHSPSGDSETDERAIKMYDIPYRCMIPKNVNGVLVSGRAISATHVAMSSARVMPTCYALGQAAGIAAAIAIEDNCDLRDVAVERLHEELRRQGVDLIR
ncbi:FAD-dependent oxidoreductase [Enterococcus thailandicus]|uniref:FAD-dependent oxidoreductase n=1 Tax=Enterococcus thailandicus TaxID=417368 RepID=UPI0022EBB426|nr:FAD-dependent oxidoreductase [Enterococcus thailandicus]MDA3965152.1 FAD-dependent oxidoreductase [Enterococcus thailandicus]